MLEQSPLNNRGEKKKSEKQDEDWVFVAVCGGFGCELRWGARHT